MNTVEWKQATCSVCGCRFEYTSRVKPPVCPNEICQYKLYYQINPETWANHRPALFD